MQSAKAGKLYETPPSNRQLSALMSIRAGNNESIAIGCIETTDPRRANEEEISTLIK
jgi:hypothetical protein